MGQVCTASSPVSGARSAEAAAPSPDSDQRHPNPREGTRSASPSSTSCSRTSSSRVNSKPQRKRGRHLLDPAAFVSVLPTPHDLRTQNVAHLECNTVNLGNRHPQEQPAHYAVASAASFGSCLLSGDSLRLQHAQLCSPSSNEAVCSQRIDHGSSAQPLAYVAPQLPRLRPIPCVTVDELTSVANRDAFAGDSGERQLPALMPVIFERSIDNRNLRTSTSSAGSALETSGEYVTIGT